MSDFFGALELELHAAAERRPRRSVSVGQVLGAVAGTALVAIAVALVVAVSSGGDGGGDAAQVTGGRAPDPVGTVIPKSETNYETRALVVANGTAPVSGPWQIEVSRTKGERASDGSLLWPAGYCLWLHVLDPPDKSTGGRSGHCGSPRSLGFRKTPGFSRSQGHGPTPSRPRPKEVLVWGRVPDRAATVVITAPGRKPIEVVPEEGPKTFPGRYYAIPVRPPRPGARINWLDANGRPGSRGIGLMPPISR
jgi:hypothetical protein